MYPSTTTHRGVSTTARSEDIRPNLQHEFCHDLPHNSNDGDPPGSAVRSHCNRDDGDLFAESAFAANEPTSDDDSVSVSCGHSVNSLDMQYEPSLNQIPSIHVVT